MDEIVYLEPDEEITSVIDKLKVLNPEVKNVLLVIPKGAALLQSVVNLKLLKKEGEALHQDLSIVTQDRIGRNLASQAGFTVYDNVDSPKPIIESPRPQPKTDEIIEMDMTGQKEETIPSGIPVKRYDELQTTPQKPKFELFKKPIGVEPTVIPQEKFRSELPKDEPAKNYANLKSVFPHKKLSKRRIILAISVILILVGVGILFYIFYPKAIVTLVMKSEPLEQELELNIDNNITMPDEEKRAIPGELMEAEKEAEKTFPATGKKEVGERARGSVTFSNDSGDSQKIPAGTDLKSESGLIFKTFEDVTVPGATASVDSHGNVIKTPGKADVAVEANEPGDKYNIGPTNFSVSGKSMISAKSVNPMSGGTSKELIVVSQNDINAAKNSLSQETYITLHDELKQKSQGKTVLDAAVKDETINEESNKKAGDEANEFSMKIKAKSSTLFFKEKDLREMVVKVLEKTISSNKMLNLSSSDEIATDGADFDIKNGIIKLKCMVKTSIVTRIDTDNVKNSIKGKNKPDAEKTLKNIKDIDSINIEFKPVWLIKKVPTRDKNIEIKIENKK